MIRGGQKYVTPGTAFVEGDASSASYFVRRRPPPRLSAQKCALRL